MEAVANRSIDKIRYSPHYHSFNKSYLSWFDLRVFYVRISNLQVDDYTPESLIVNHIPLDPDTLLEVNGSRSSICSEGVRFLLRRDRADKKTEEATFINTDSVRFTGNVKFEVLEGENLILLGVLEMCQTDGFAGESNNNLKRKWTMSSELGASSILCFLRRSESVPLTVEVYVAGCFAGSPLILTKSLQISSRRRQARRPLLAAIPETETECLDKDETSGLGLQDLTSLGFSSWCSPLVGLGEWFANGVWCTHPFSGIVMPAQLASRCISFGC